MKLYSRYQQSNILFEQIRLVFKLVLEQLRLKYRPNKIKYFLFFKSNQMGGKNV